MPSSPKQIPPRPELTLRQRTNSNVSRVSQGSALYPIVEHADEQVEAGSPVAPSDMSTSLVSLQRWYSAGASSVSQSSGHSVNLNEHYASCCTQSLEALDNGADVSTFASHVTRELVIYERATMACASEPRVLSDSEAEALGADLEKRITTYLRVGPDTTT